MSEDSREDYEALARYPRWLADQHSIALQFARAAGWRCAACGRKFKGRYQPSEPWTSLMPSWKPVHQSCIPPLSMHDLRETWGEPQHDKWLWQQWLPDLRTVAP